jgi:hypothetical protein
MAALKRIAVDAGVHLALLFRGWRVLWMNLLLPQWLKRKQF